jgi:hypothetical protein
MTAELTRDRTRRAASRQRTRDLLFAFLDSRDIRSARAARYSHGVAAGHAEDIISLPRLCQETARRVACRSTWAAARVPVEPLECGELHDGERRATPLLRSDLYPMTPPRPLSTAKASRPVPETPTTMLNGIGSDVVRIASSMSARPHRSRSRYTVARARPTRRRSNVRSGRERVSVRSPPLGGACAFAAAAPSGAACLNSDWWRVSGLGAMLERALHGSGAGAGAGGHHRTVLFWASSR